MEISVVENIVSNLENLKKIVEKCLMEAISSGRAKQQIQQWRNFLVDIESHVVNLEKYSDANSLGNLQEPDLVWIRSISRKLDYFESSEIDSWPDLERSAENLFVSTVP